MDSAAAGLWELVVRRSCKWPTQAQAGKQQNEASNNKDLGFNVASIRMVGEAHACPRVPTVRVSVGVSGWVDVQRHWKP